MLGHGMALGGAWYNDRLERLVVCKVIEKGGCGVLADIIIFSR